MGAIMPSLAGAPVRVIQAPQSGMPSIRPSIIDRAIGVFAPQVALRRYEARVKMGAAYHFFGTGGYEGARTDRPATKNWQPRIGSADADAGGDLPMLRARAADLDRNDPIGSGISETKSTHIVGTGIVPRARIDREFLGLSDQQAEEWERDCDRIVTWWMESRACDITGRAEFYTLEELVLLGALARGDILAIWRFKERPGDMLGTRVQLIEADRICNPSGKQNSDTLIDGVETDEDGRPVRYHTLNRHPGELGYGYAGSVGFVFGAGENDWTPVDAFDKQGVRRALHVYRQRRPGQTRGIPLLAPVIERLKQISRYGESELMAAVIQSFFTVFVKTTSGDEGLPDMGDPNTVGAATSTPMTANDVRLGQGAVVGLAPGEDISLANPSRPNSSFDPFMLAWFRQIGIAVNIPYEILIKHFAASYSASRGAMLEFYRGVTKDRTWLVRNFCQPVREWVVEEAITRGLLSAPGFFGNALVRAAYCAAEWTGPVMGQLDPEAEVNAAEKRVALGISTLQEETSQMTGGDWERKHHQRVKEQRMRVKDGLDAEPIGERIITEPREPTPAEGQPPKKSPTTSERETEREKEREAA